MSIRPGTAWSRTLAALLVGLPITLLAGSAGAREEPPAFFISSHQPGVYQVTYEDLVAAGLPSEPLASTELALRNLGEDVPAWVADGGDGLFGPGDRLEFVGEVLAGDGAYFHEHSPWNVYRLSLDADPRRMASIPPVDEPAEGGDPDRRLRRLRHLEEDRLLIRASGSGTEAEPPELWFWTKLTHLDSEAWSLPLDLSDLDATAGGKVALRIRLQALSRPRSKPDGESDHRLEVTLDGSPLGTATWDGKTSHLLDLPELDVALFAGGEQHLELRIPRRAEAEGPHPMVDVLMLNWLEIDYPRRQVVDDGQVEVHLGAGPDGAAIRLSSRSVSDLVAFGNHGSRVEAAPAAAPEGRRFSFRPVPGETSYHLVSDGRFLSPARIEIDRPSDLRAEHRRADYLMIAHRRLIEAVRPLAELHRRRGLEVAVVDVADVYDEFNHGIVHPRAIRDFIAHAYQNWQPPAPRFVLLVGDASWDTKNSTVDDANYANWSDRQLTNRERFAAKQATVYAEDPRLNRRQLIPTWNHPTQQGHSASDNFFVAIAGDDHLPDLAIGRLPVVEPLEVSQIIDKIEPYVSTPEVGPWRRSVLFITNESRGFQRQSDRLVQHLSAEGYASEKIYPASTEVANEHHSQRILDILNRGQLAVHFLGHGGRYIWRTGPPDLKKNHDLFTLDHLEQLEPTERLPVVLSLTCFSAPFDHPNADSIGEKLLRIPKRGAIAVLAASWRNSPSSRWGQTLLEELTAAGATVGEAVMRSKRSLKNRMFVETYNLLGDPAVPMPEPAAAITLAAAPEEGSALGVRGVIDLAEFSGEVLVELVDEGGAVLRESSSSPAGREFALRIEATAEELAAARRVRAYAWDVARGLDALGTAELAAEQAAGPAAGEGEGSGR